MRSGSGLISCHLCDIGFPSSSASHHHFHPHRRLPPCPPHARFPLCQTGGALHSWLRASPVGVWGLHCTGDMSTEAFKRIAGKHPDEMDQQERDKALKGMDVLAWMCKPSVLHSMVGYNIKVVQHTPHTSCHSAQSHSLDIGLDAVSR